MDNYIYNVGLDKIGKYIKIVKYIKYGYYIYNFGLDKIGKYIKIVKYIKFG